MRPRSERAESLADAAQGGAWLAVVPIIATAGFYVLPPSLQRQTLIQFVPQIVAYAALAVWALSQSHIAARLGLEPVRLREGIRWGVPMGLLLGSLNAGVILYLVPSFGHDIRFLQDTPHARIPFWLMVPWFIGIIAFCVELNFRGFLLGRLAELERRLWRGHPAETYCPLALAASAVTFSFDPFMVHTFRYLHWIAIWDGVLWGAMRVRRSTLWIPIIAHATEVVVLYLAVRAALE
jgi:membrane protease YdiL (CAAX protease family)